MAEAEISALRPLFEELQLQYDFVASQVSQIVPLADDNFDQQYEATWKEFEEQFSKILPQHTITTYNTSLPTLEEIIGKPDFSLMAKEQLLEMLDLQKILQDTLDDAQISLNELAGRALKLETSLLKLRVNKQKVVTLIYKALQMGYRAAGHVGRAAYCTYSHLPQLNASLHTLYEAADCFVYTTSLMVTIQNETHQTVTIVRRNIFELAAVYKKVLTKKSLMGKIVTIIMNIKKIAGDVLKTIQTARYALDMVENQLPAAAGEATACGFNVAPQIPFVLESVSNVTECIFFKDETMEGYDFLKSEEEYNKQMYSDSLDDALDEQDDDESI